MSFSSDFTHLMRLKWFERFDNYAFVHWFCSFREDERRERRPSHLKTIQNPLKEEKRGIFSWFSFVWSFLRQTNVVVPTRFSPILIRWSVRVFHEKFFSKILMSNVNDSRTESNCCNSVLERTFRRHFHRTISSVNYLKMMTNVFHSNNFLLELKEFERRISIFLKANEND